MSVNLSMFVIGTAIFLFFLQEFAGIYKKTISVPGVKLLAPLFLASWFVENNSSFILWLLLQCKEIIFFLLGKSNILVSANQNIIKIIELFLLPIIPFLAFLIWEKKRKIHTIRPFTYIATLIIWLFAATILTLA